MRGRDVTQYPGSCNLPSPLSLFPSLPPPLSPSSPLSLFPSLPPPFPSSPLSPFSPSLLGWRKLTPTLLTRDTLHSATGGETTAHGINPHSLTFTPSPPHLFTLPSLPHLLLPSPPHSCTHRYLLLSRAFNTWRLFVAISKQVQTILVSAPDISIHAHTLAHFLTLTPSHPHLTLTPLTRSGTPPSPPLPLSPSNGSVCSHQA